MTQMKEQIKTTEKELNKREMISNLSVAELKTLVIRMFRKFTEDLNSIEKGLVRNEGYTN